MEFPIYRKYPHNRTYFKILSLSEFEEINIIGQAYAIHHFVSKIFPDRLLIQDMIDNKYNHWNAINEEEYDSKKLYCIGNLQKLHNQ